MDRKILVIEDDPDIARLIAMHVGDIGCRAEIAATGTAGLAAVRNKSFDLVVLDLMLPGVDGLTICREIRAGSATVPVLMLTAKSSELDRVLGLEIGADDYLTKPFSIPELMARIKALFRRVDAAQSQPETDAKQSVVERDGLKLDPGKRKVWVDGEQVELTAREFDLLFHFAAHPGFVYNRSQLLEQVWGYNHDGYEHTVNTHINRLRGKIERDPAKPRFIQTVWGVGYKFAE
jgi:DNA-binding response OmpR family regulator